jgi:hypothetical protein
MNEENKSKSPSINAAMDPDKFNAMVTERAYFKAEKRGFAPGHELDDWLEAEKEISNQCCYWLQEID